MKHKKSYGSLFFTYVRLYLKNRNKLPNQLPKLNILCNLFSELHYGKSIPEGTEIHKWIYNEENKKFFDDSIGMRQYPIITSKISVIKKHNKSSKVKKIPKEKTYDQTTWEYKLEYYYKYLKSSAWRKIAKLVLERDNYQCCKCSSTKELQVHHKTYEHIFFEKEHLEDLETLCSICHAKETIRLGQNKTKV